MGHIRESVDVDAPVETCWALQADAARFPDWNTTVIEVKDISGPIDRVGASFTIVSKVLGRRIEATNEVTRVEPMKLFEFRGSGAGGARGDFRTEFEPRGTGTRVTTQIDYDLPGGWFGDIADKLFGERQLERDVKHSSEHFKALAERAAKVREVTAGGSGST